MDCLFCKIAAGELPCHKLHEDERTLAFLDLYPGCEGHCLVIPKAHAENCLDLPEDDRDAVMRTARIVSEALTRELGSDGFNLHQSNGKAAGQVIFHFHLHILPRREGDGLRSPWKSQEADAEALKALSARVTRRLSADR